MKTLNFIVPASWVFFALATISFAQEAKKDQELFDQPAPDIGHVFVMPRKMAGWRRSPESPIPNSCAGIAMPVRVTSATELKEPGGRLYDGSGRNKTCLKCHGRESAMILTIDKQANRRMFTRRRNGMHELSFIAGMHGDGKSTSP
jgi:hypothetical protein